MADAIRAAAERLGATSDTARLDAELLMAHVLETSRSQMLLTRMRDDAAPHAAAFARLVNRRAAHEPVAHLLGEQEFYGLPFAVSLATLIPRGDSETIVEAALEHAAADARVLDMGTGSGALLLAFLHERPSATGIGIDASAQALAVAQHKPNVYIDLSGWSPKYFPDILVKYCNSILRKKVLFGSDWPMITPERWLSDFEKIESVIPQLLLEHSDIDVLICNAGHGDFQALENFSSKQISKFINLNLISDVGQIVGKSDFASETGVTFKFRHGSDP